MCSTNTNHSSFKSFFLINKENTQEQENTANTQWEEPGRRRRQEEPAGDPEHSQGEETWWSRVSEGPWWRLGRQTQGDRGGRPRGSQ